MTIKFSPEEFQNLKRLLHVYEWGQRTLLTKLNIIQEDFKTFQGTSPIEYIKGRIKAPESIAQKLHRNNIALTAANVRTHLNDVAGIRIICSFARDIHQLVELLRVMPGVNILDERDYITNPKPSGYRSYHVIMEVPVFYSGKTESVTIEVQLRTEAMNFWASLEHKARYKYHNHVPRHLCDELVACADKIAELDHQMFTIHETISQINQ